MRTGIDWEALLAGSGVGFVSFVTLFSVLGLLGVLPVQDTATEMLVLVVIGMPGAITAGYLHAEEPSSGALYGMAATFLGVVLPMVLTVILFLALVDFVGGPPGTVVLVVVAGVVPGLAVIVAASGIVGGVIGAVLRGRRTD